MIAIEEETWQGDTLRFRMRAFGQTAAATIEVLEDALRMEVAQAWRVDVRMLAHRPTKEWPLPALAIGMCGDPFFVTWAAGQELNLHEPRSPRWIMQRWGTEFRARRRG